MATTQIDTVSTGVDKAKLAAVVALVVASLAGFYPLGKQGTGPVGGPGVGLGGCGRCISHVRVGGVSLSALRVMPSWKRSRRLCGLPARKTLQMTGYVFAFVVLMALFLWLTDKTWSGCCTT